MGVADVAVGVVFSGLSPLIVEDMAEECGVVVARARTPGGPVACPGCGTESDSVHRYHRRTVADLCLDGRAVVVGVRVRRLACLAALCGRTFREQVPGVLERYQRRTTRLTTLVGAVVRELAGRASVRVLAALAIRMSRQTAVRVLLRIPLPPRSVPSVISVDDFALRRRHTYGTVIIDPLTHQRIDVLPERRADPLAAWLNAHPDVEIVVRDGSTTFAEAVRRALPNATQISDRWQCAMRRLVVSPAQPGGTRKEVLGSDGLPGAER